MSVIPNKLRWGWAMYRKILPMRYSGGVFFRCFDTVSGSPKNERIPDRRQHADPSPPEYGAIIRPGPDTALMINSQF